MPTFLETLLKNSPAWIRRCLCPVRRPPGGIPKSPRAPAPPRPRAAPRPRLWLCVVASSSSSSYLRMTNNLYLTPHRIQRDSLLSASNTRTVSYPRIAHSTPTSTQRRRCCAPPPSTPFHAPLRLSTPLHSPPRSSTPLSGTPIAMPLCDSLYPPIRHTTPLHDSPRSSTPLCAPPRPYTPLHPHTSAILHAPPRPSTPLHVTLLRLSTPLHLPPLYSTPLHSNPRRATTRHATPRRAAPRGLSDGP